MKKSGNRTTTGDSSDESDQSSSESQPRRDSISLMVRNIQDENRKETLGKVIFSEFSKNFFRKFWK